VVSLAAYEAEIERLRDVLRVLSESTGKQTVRVDLAIEKDPTRILLVITASKEASETDIGAVVVEYLERCGLRPAPVKRKARRRG
jgi:hypothetical protein